MDARTDVDERPGVAESVRLHRDAVAIWGLLRDLDDDDHQLRARLLMARDEVRAASARRWRERGWRSITDDR